MINDNEKLSLFIDQIYCKLNNDSEFLSLLEFKQFFDLTANGINTVPLEFEIIKNEFLLADRKSRGNLSREDMAEYVSQFYNAICDIIISQLYKLSDKNGLIKNNPTFKFADNSISTYLSPNYYKHEVPFFPSETPTQTSPSVLKYFDIPKSPLVNFS